MALALAMQWLVIIFFCSLTGFFNLLSMKWFSCKSKNCHSNLLSSSKIMKWIETLNVLLWMATWIATGFVEVRYGLWNPVLWFCHVWHMTFIIKYVSIGFDSLFNIKWFWYEIVQGEVFLQLYVVDRQNDAESRDSVAGHYARLHQGRHFGEICRHGPGLVLSLHSRTSRPINRNMRSLTPTKM